VRVEADSGKRGDVEDPVSHLRHATFGRDATRNRLRRLSHIKFLRAFRL